MMFRKNKQIKIKVSVNKLQDDDNWWKQIQEEYKREKEHNKVNMNRGWANPFGNQPTLSKDILLGK